MAKGCVADTPAIAYQNKMCIRDRHRTFLVDADKAAGQPLCWRRQKRKVEPALLAFVVHALAHIAADLQAELLAFFALPVVLSGCLLYTSRCV